jgi:hypothetical protein
LLSDHPLNWKFQHESIPNEFLDQIFPLNTEASIFLRDFKNSQKHLSSAIAIKKHFINTEFLDIKNQDTKAIKKWLFERGISFDQTVFCLLENSYGFHLTWKMIIKFSESLFGGSDVFVWDKTSNWCLIFDHEDVFCFGKNLMTPQVL